VLAKAGYHKLFYHKKQLSIAKTLGAFLNFTIFAVLCKNSAPGGKGKRRRENWQAKLQKAAFAARSG
jgi:hypothetical protein